MSMTESGPPYASGEDDQEEDFVNVATDESPVGAPADIEERRVESSSAGGENHNSMVENTNNDDERKPPSAARATASAASPLRGHHNSDCRFLCAICLDTVSDEPVVTRCGHIFCWPCLYQWLAPGMLLGEYYAAFGGGATIGTATNNNHGGSSLNHFISDTLHQTAGYNNSNYGPYNPARWNEQRRCCPVCKAFCSVDSVIPVYIHVHAGAADGGGEEENTSFMQPSQQQLQQLEEQPTTNNNNDEDEHNAHSTVEEQLSTPISPQSLDPSTANMGLRQRRPPAAPTTTNRTTSSTSTSSSNNNVRQQQQQQQESTLLDSPEQTQRLYENIPTNVTVTPVIANLGGGGGVREEDVPVPSRPLISPTPAASSSRHRQEYDNNNDMPRPPVLNSSAAAASTSSSFRLQYRPRHNAGYRQTQMGGIMGLVSGIVHSIDNIGAATENQQQQQRSLSSRRSEVPVLHRSDGGLGGIGRQNNQQGTALQHLNNAGGVGGNDDSMMGSEEDSSLAREFLSRLVSKVCLSLYD